MDSPLNWPHNTTDSHTGLTPTQDPPLPSKILWGPRANKLVSNMINASVHGARSSDLKKWDLWGKVLFLWFIGSRVTIRKRLFQHCTSRSGFIKYQSLILAIWSMIWCTTQGKADPKSKICKAKLCSYGPLGSGLAPETDFLNIGPLGMELLSVKVSYRQFRPCFGWHKARNGGPQR